MPPYTPNRSKAQQRKMFALANEGKVSMADAKGRAKATDYHTLPVHVGKAAARGLRKAIKGER